MVRRSRSRSRGASTAKIIRTAARANNPPSNHPSVVFVDSANAPVACAPDATAVPDGYGLMPGDTVTADAG